MTEGRGLLRLFAPDSETVAGKGAETGGIRPERTRRPKTARTLLAPFLARARRELGFMDEGPSKDACAAMVSFTERVIARLDGETAAHNGEKAALKSKVTALLARLDRAEERIRYLENLESARTGAAGTDPPCSERGSEDTRACGRTMHRPESIDSVPDTDKQKDLSPKGCADTPMKDAVDGQNKRLDLNTREDGSQQVSLLSAQITDLCTRLTVETSRSVALASQNTLLNQQLAQAKHDAEELKEPKTLANRQTWEARKRISELEFQLARSVSEAEKLSSASTYLKSSLAKHAQRLAEFQGLQERAQWLQEKLKWTEECLSYERKTHHPLELQDRGCW